MYTVNQLARKSDAAAHVVRYYLRIRLIEPTSQQKNGYRLFSPDQVNRLRFIRMAKKLGFTLSEIRQILQHSERHESPCRDVRKIIEQRIEENRVKIDEMQKLQARMESALSLWQSMPDGEPDGNSVCHLIESFETIPNDDPNSPDT